MRYMIETERSDLFDVSIVIAMRVHIIDEEGFPNEDGKLQDRIAGSIGR